MVPLFPVGSKIRAKGAFFKLDGLLKVVCLQCGGSDGVLYVKKESIWFFCKPCRSKFLLASPLFSKGDQ
jgi:hypothetical protein